MFVNIFQKIVAKLGNLTVKSKFFKETTAKEMFGDEPVKRSNHKLMDIKERLERFVSFLLNEIFVLDSRLWDLILRKLNFERTFY